LLSNAEVLARGAIVAARLAAKSFPRHGSLKTECDDEHGE
jgi:hypothetical protein